ncbi:MAG: 4-(cytidine 5'-diphospho)-2-C-methyl-D-erythritol kinase [Cyanobacteria bacterium]|nr:4-(cytidine 5'-diphospho)-2-C-methyl-D-erythritol kinase [Cyanobacteriota bacterium]
MGLYQLRAAAKINLYLEILGHRSDGFHELIMVMQSLDLADVVTVQSLVGSGVHLHCDHPQVPKDHTNLAYRAAALMAQTFPQAAAHHGGVDITIEKNIPIGAGLAGGSADAAATLVGIDLLWQLGLTQQELQDLGAQLGSDIPFCISGGTALATGRGEQLDPLYGLTNLYAVLGKYNSLSVSTPWAYKTYRAQFGESYLDLAMAGADRRAAIHSGPMVGAIAHQDSTQIGQLLHNDLEKAVLPAHPAVAALKTELSQAGGLGTLMSGSGPTVFTLTPTRDEAEAIARQVKARLPDPDLGLWVTQFAPIGVQLAPD